MEAPFVATSETSRAAAEAIAPKRVIARERVYDAIRAAGTDGLTDEQVQNRIGMNPSTQRPRRVELVEAGRLVSIGVRATSSGRKATVWMAVPFSDRK